MRLGLLAVAGLSLAGCPSNEPCNTAPIPRSVPAPSGSVGDPCGTVHTSCAAGLSCGQTPVPGGHASSCTLDCSDAGCPTGTICFTDRSTLTSSCQVACRTDADCETSVRAGTCASDGDGGICQPRSCAPPGYSGDLCPGAYTCVDYLPCGCNPDHPCDIVAGWCERGVDAG